MNRLERRLIILRGKRKGAFDPNQPWLERADRARAARQVRHHIRRMRPVMLLSPRWSQPQRFLDDVAVDVGIGSPRVRCRALSMHPLQGRTASQAWAWVVQAITEFCGVPLEGAAWQAVSRSGFRQVMRQLLATVQSGPRRCLLMHGMQHLPLECLYDLIQVFDEYLHKHREEQRNFNLLMCGSIDTPAFEVEGLLRLTLPDFASDEALGALVETVGPIDRGILEAVTSLVGGVPALIDGLAGAAPKQLAEVVRSRDSIWRCLGKFSHELRSAFDIVEADEALSDCLEHIADGTDTGRSKQAAQLLRAGLVRPQKRDSDELTLRAPMFVDLATA